MTATKATRTPESSSRPKACWGTIFALLLWSVPVTSGGHEISRQAVIVDTDMALDDARALILLTQVPSIEIAAVVTVGGSSSPRRGAENVLAIMRALGKTDVLVGAGAERAVAPPPWRAMSESLGGTELSSLFRDSITAAGDILKRVSSEHPEGLTYVCLGPLSNLAELIQSDPVLARGVIHRICVQGDAGFPRWTSWNTQQDTLAARIVFTSGLPIYSCVLPDSAYLRFSDSLLTGIEACSTDASRLVARLHRGPGVRDLVHKGHFRCWDETVALAIADESLARFEPVDGISQCYSLAGWDASGARRRYIGLLTGRDDAMEHSSVILAPGLTDSSLFTGDVRQMAGSVIERYGTEEWRAVVLTTEIHGHLGIYSIAGAKMGIRALELLGVQTGDVRVASAAGHEPPLSCLNDGLQVATGATLGQGTITIISGETAPAAAFISGSRHLRLELRGTIAEQIGGTLRQLVQRCGGLTPEYWVQVRQLAIQYWRDLDRREAFDESWE